VNDLTPERYQRFSALRVARPEEHVLEIVLSDPDRLNALGHDGHRHLAEIWREVDRDPETRVVVVRGEGTAFSAGGDLDLVEDIARDFDVRARLLREARDLVHNMVDCSKPIVSAMHGVAVGAGLVVGVLADVPIATPDCLIIDGHTRLGVPAGDHAVLIWPLLIGMAKAKYHLLTCEPLSGLEAERIGLIALCVPEDELLDRAYGVARQLAHGSQTAIRWTKLALNNWLRSAGPAFDASLALEFLGFSGPDVREGIAAIRERRPPRFTGDGSEDTWEPPAEDEG
jgi:enoyl-CoA hydratase